MPGNPLRASIAVFSIAALALPALALPALAQAPAKAAAEVVLTTGSAPAPVTVLGEIRAEAHQKSMFSKISGRDMVNDQLREKAAKMGADAVVEIKYEDNNPMFSKKGFIAVGTAVKFSAATVTAMAPTATAATIGATAATAPVAPPKTEAAAAPAAAPAAAQGPKPAAMIILSEQDLAGRAYTRIGPVSTEAHQTSMFPKTPTRDILNNNLREAAAKIGADAVILIKYTENNPMFSKKGSTAEGVAIRFDTPPMPVAATPAPGPAPAAAAAVAPPPPAPSSPSPAAPPRPAAAIAPAAIPAIILSEQNIAQRPYSVLGPISSEVNQATASLDKTGRESLDEDMRKQAAKLGADAVIMIKYAPASPGHGPTAIGVAVKFQ